MSHSANCKVLFVTVLLLLLPAEGRDEQRSVRGHIFAAESETTFILEDGTCVQLASSPTIVQDDRPFAGRLVVGLEVEARGWFESPDQVRADRLSVLTRLDGTVEGMAVLDGRRPDGSHIILLADGRRLRWLADSPLTPPSSDNATAILDIASLQPGVMLDYQGRWSDGGTVEVVSLSAWENRVEPKEKEIYEKFEPATIVPIDETSGPPVLQVGKNRYRLLSDTAAQRYIDRLGTRLLPPFWRETRVAKRFGHSFWFAVVDHQRPQASAFPGGVVVVHSRLLSMVENEAQLAFILAHEIAHVLQEHPWREYRHQRGKLLFLRWSTAGLGYVVESAIRKGYQRELEAQSDRLALMYMAQAGFDPRQALRLLSRLEERQEGLSALFWESHRSYPQRRRALMQELVQLSLGGLQYSSLATDSPAFAEVRRQVSTAMGLQDGEPD